MQTPLKPSIQKTRSLFEVIEDLTVYTPGEFSLDALNVRKFIGDAVRLGIMSHQEGFMWDNQLCKRFGLM